MPERPLGIPASRVHRPSELPAGRPTLARNLLCAVAMHEDYLDRVRERLATGKLLDAAFDQLLPLAARLKSTLHWTPVGVARLAALRLAEHGARYVLDAGSGPGKFCVVGASSRPRLTFVGIERSASLVSAARHLTARLKVPNAYFEHGDALGRTWTPFDGFYFFNPFAQNAFVEDDVFDAERDAAKHRTGSDAMTIVKRLREARRGSVLVTYHGLGGPIPSSYELTAEEDSGSGCLRTWVKKREREEAWVHLDHGSVSRLSWCAPPLDPRLRERRNANTAGGDMALQRTGTDLQLGRGSDRTAALGLQSGLDDLAGE